MNLNALISNQFLNSVEQYEKKAAGFDDLELISYLDQDCNKNNRLTRVFGLNSGKNRQIKSSYSSYLFNYDESNENETEDEFDDKLSSYFMSDEEDEKERKSFRNGQIGLDNLGKLFYLSLLGAFIVLF
jgi:hypothetical protein